MANVSQDLGPLPGTDRNDELERESLAALDAILPKDQFRIRSEPGREQGVDRCIEVLVSSDLPVAVDKEARDLILLDWRQVQLVPRPPLFSWAEFTVASACRRNRFRLRRDGMGDIRYLLAIIDSRANEA